MESAAFNRELMADEEDNPLMEESVGVRNTTSDFLRSFSILSDDSDFDELDEPDTPGDFLDGPADGELSHLGYQSSVRHTTTSGISVDAGKSGDQAEGKIIPFSSIHRPAKGFTHIRPDCWMKEPVQVAITDVQRETHPHMTRKAFNPNLYTIEVTHGEYKWTVRRRYKHFDSLHKALRLFRARYTLPVPTKQHRERRQSIKEERKERKIKKKKTKKVSRFPKKPEIMVREDALEKRREHLEQYLQSILESKWYRNHTEVLNFLEVSELSFVNRLGQKWKEGDVTKCSGGRRISIGCCGCLKKYHVAGRWSKRWLVVKDTFIAYIRPRDGLVCDVLLMDSRFRVESGMSATGAKHGVLIMNQSRHLLAKAWTSRKADEWEASIKQAAETTGKDFTEENRYESYAPVRENSFARWFVDGASYFEAVAEALEKAREEIFITDWWLSPEIYLKRHVTDREKWRLDEILARKANEGVKVFVILYKELEIALTINSHYSKHALMNKSPNIKVIRHPDHVAAGNRVLLWAHHEKIVCIDQKTAFLGGFDLCYGRWDDEFHRMTDLGSVVYGVQKPRNEQVTEESPHTPVPVGGRPSHKKSKAKPRPPSTILESPENNMADSGIDECGWNISKESEEDGTQLSKETEEDGIQLSKETEEDGTQLSKETEKDSTQFSNGKENDAQGPNGKVSGTKLSNGSIQKTNMNGIAGSENDGETHRHSLHSEHDFGSNDPLTENDSLENVNKESYTNVVADVHVYADAEDVQEHDDGKDVHVHAKSENEHINSLSETADVKHDTDKKVDYNDDVTKKSEVDKGRSFERQRGDSKAKRSPEKRGDSNTKLESPRERMSKCDAVDEEDIELVDGAKERKVDLDSVVKQIITKHDNISNYGAIKGHSGKIAQTDNTDAQIELVSKETKVPNKSSLKSSPSNKVKQSVENLNSDASNTSVSKFNNTDLNRNQTKGSVRFKEQEDGEIREEHITPVQGMLVEATPKKDAAGKRETWASRKLRKTFRLKDPKEKYEAEDQTDGKANKPDDDDDHHAKFRNKWRMVLNIKKLEHGGKKPEDELAVPPTSPFVKQATTSPHHSLSSIILHPFRSQRQDSEDDMMYLYPWRKRLFRRSEESSVAVKSVMKTSVADDYEGLEGSSKLWIGKDYVNFIHKDPVDVHNPFEDFIERDKTPRMPWHDIGAVVYGKAARDVARHFILRWNFCKTEKFKTNKQFPILLPKSYAKCEVSPAIKEITYGVNTQILRSVCGWSAGINTTEKSIHEAYIDCIKRSKHYIYIENQFFISQVGDHSLVRNEIAEALVERIEKAYREKETFRVYVVLPLLPAFEGEIGANGGYAIQAVLHWNYKSMSKGENSLWANLQKKVDDPKKYIIFCGLRSHAELRGKLVTELVYVHSKLMIVDDNTVIIGSANINDRSMNGTRDSELAVMVEDTQTFPVKMAGKDHMAGRFASSLRRTLFREHLGIGEMDFSVDLSDPVCDEFYKTVWLHRASINTTIYHKVFKCIPDDGIKTFAELREMATKTPLAETDPVAANLELKKVQGRIVFMPLYFLEHEDTIMAQGANKEAMMPMKLWL